MDKLSYVLFIKLRNNSAYIRVISKCFNMLKNSNNEILPNPWNSQIKVIFFNIFEVF